MVSENLAPSVHDPVRHAPKISVSDSIMETLSVRPCTLRELSLFGRGYLPGTSAVNISARYESGSYQDFCMNNLKIEAYNLFLWELARVLKCSPDELERIGYLCYNARRWFGSLSDVPSLPFQIAKIPNDKIRSIGNTESNLWISSAA